MTWDHHHLPQQSEFVIY